jgi:hypothetical protein
VLCMSAAPGMEIDAPTSISISAPAGTAMRAESAAIETPATIVHQPHTQSHRR